MKKIIKVILPFLVIALCKLTININFKPIKQAIKIHELNNDISYIVVIPAKVTGADWMIIDSNNCKFDEEDYIRIVGNEPKFLDFSIQYADNKFICYGKYVQEDYEDETGIYDVFESSAWDIVYPIKRNSIFSFFMPKSYLTELDITQVDGSVMSK